MRMLYKYPQAPFPYQELVAGNRARGKAAPELELLDTGVFDDGHYFDVFIEYAKHAPDDVFMRVRVFNRGPIGRACAARAATRSRSRTRC